MNSPSVRVEWPIVSTVVEGSRPVSVFPRVPAGLRVTAAGLILTIFLRCMQQYSDLLAAIEPACKIGSPSILKIALRKTTENHRIAPIRPKLFLATEGGVQ